MSQENTITAHFQENDIIMHKLTQQYPSCPLLASTAKIDIFSTLAQTIISQQLSVKAAATIHQRVINIVKICTPQNILDTDIEILRTAGLSKNKVRYLKALAEHTLIGTLNATELQTMSDEDAITCLTQVPGIGRWTAEMFLIFQLHRQDIFSFADAGLLRAIKKLYGTEADPKEISIKWQPYRSIASWYLWQSLDNEPFKE